MGAIGISGVLYPEGVVMRLTLEWLVEALRDKSRPEIGTDELSLRATLYDFIDRRLLVSADLAPLETGIKRLERFHCEHEFKDTKKGCLESIFCSKCGALHPDWEEWFYPYFCPEDGPPLNSIYIGGKHYRTKAGKPKKGKKK